MKRLLSIVLICSLLAGGLSTPAMAALTSYEKAYAYSVMDIYLANNITDDMTDFEKANVCGKFPLMFGYDLTINTAAEMIVYGSGNCWAVTDALLYMLKQLGIQCEKFDENNTVILYTNSLHRNVRAILDGKYYIVDSGGVMGRAPDSYSKYDVTYNPTCTSTGTYVWYDTGSSGTESETIPALGHLDENQDGTCERCNEVICEEHITEVLPAVEVSCEQDGLTEGSRCSSCGKILQEQTVIPALGHEFADGVCVKCGSNNPFKDITNDDWFYDSVLWAYQNNVTGGTSATTFGPNDGCTRAQVVTFLWAANGKPEPTTKTNPFKDVNSSDWYYKAVLWAVENGITSGIREGEFGPNESCTRAQVVTFLYAAVGKPNVLVFDSSFSDVSAGDWFCEEVQWAVSNGITGGIGDGKFGPNNTCTRGQVVTFLYKVYGNK